MFSSASKRTLPAEEDDFSSKLAWIQSLFSPNQQGGDLLDFDLDSFKDHGSVQNSFKEQSSMKWNESFRNDSFRSIESLSEHPTTAADACLEPIPKDHPDPARTPTLLADELNELNPDQRSRILEEIHGIPVTETENNLEYQNEKLEALQQAVRKIPDHKKKAYLQALETSRDYVQDREFLLMFLRQELFDAKAAAHLLVNHFEMKLELFGPEVLGRPVRISDLSVDDMETVKSGFLQPLPRRDRSGRAILALLQQEVVYKTVENAQRAKWYICMTLLEDPETRRNGIVVVQCCVKPIDVSTLDPNYIWKTCGAMRYVPLNAKALHFTIDDACIRMVSALVVLASGKRYRSRFRFQEGSYTERRYQLLSYGIPVDCLPITEAGDCKTSQHMKWIAKRKHKDNMLEKHGAFDGIDVPTNRDVLIGRGTPYHNHPGVLMLNGLIAQYADEYEKSKRGEKLHIVHRVVRTIQDTNKGRFLKKEKSGWWVEACGDDCIQKVNHAFRARRLKGGPDNINPGVTASLGMESGKRARVSMTNM